MLATLNASPAVLGIFIDEEKAKEAKRKAIEDYKKFGYQVWSEEADDDDDEVEWDVDLHLEEWNVTQNRVEAHMALGDWTLYHLPRPFYRSNAAHNDAMKTAQSSLTENNRYRSQQADRVLAAATRFGLDLKGTALLDLGCNDGALTAQYAGRGPSSVIGVDVDLDAVYRAQREHVPPRVEYRACSTTTLPVDSASIGGIFCYDVFEHVANPSAILAECRRVLRPGGWMLIGTWGWGHPFAPYLWATMPVPWAHVFFSERTVLRACRRVYHAPWYQPTFHDLDSNSQRHADRYLETSIDPQYLNKHTISDFEGVFRGRDSTGN